MLQQQQQQPRIQWVYIPTEIKKKEKGESKRSIYLPGTNNKDESNHTLSRCHSKLLCNLM